MKLRVRWGGAGKRWAKGVRTKAGGSGGFPGGSVVNLPARQETQLQSFGQEVTQKEYFAAQLQFLVDEFCLDEEDGE